MDHPAVGFALEVIPQILEQRKPKIVVFDQVAGFADIAPGAEESMLDQFVSMLSNYFAAVRVVQLDLKHWATASRDRCEAHCFVKSSPQEPFPV
jgi:hypothetical protein